MKTKNKLSLIYTALVHGPWMLVLHAGPASKLVGNQVVFFAKGCRYVDGEIVYDPGFIEKAKSEVIPLSSYA